MSTSEQRLGRPLVVELTLWLSLKVKCLSTDHTSVLFPGVSKRQRIGSPKYSHRLSRKLKYLWCVTWMALTKEDLFLKPRQRPDLCWRIDRGFGRAKEIAGIYQQSASQVWDQRALQQPIQYYCASAVANIRVSRLTVFPLLSSYTGRSEPFQKRQQGRNRSTIF